MIICVRLVLPIRNGSIILASYIIYLFVRFLPILEAGPIIVDLRSFGEKLAAYSLLPIRQNTLQSKQVCNFIHSNFAGARHPSRIYKFIYLSAFLIPSSNLTYLTNKPEVDKI